MHAQKLLHKMLHNSGAIGHVMRLRALLKGVDGLLRGGKLSLTHLGRHLPTDAHEKHNIKCIDRLLGNPWLHQERQAVYGVLARWVISASSRPVIVVDWSDCTEGRDALMLTASVPVAGRALPIYEEVHPLSDYNTSRVHESFLAHLKAILPPNCRPILITDAGFRGPWFQAVERLGWDWVGRIRTQVQYMLDETGPWRSIQALYTEATSKICYVGAGYLSREKPYAAHLYLVKKKPSQSGKSAGHHGANTVAQRCRKQYKDPWLLATSLPHDSKAARRIEKLYALRMTIEETFRDLKNPRWGLGLRYARTRHVPRMGILLLIGTLALYATWVAGLIGQTRQWSRYFQANTEQRRNVLSIFFLGQRILQQQRFTLSPKDINRAITALPIRAVDAYKEAEFVGIP